MNKVVAVAKQYHTQWTVAQSSNYVIRFQPQADGDGASSLVKSQKTQLKYQLMQQYLKLEKKLVLDWLQEIQRALLWKLKQ